MRPASVPAHERDSVGPAAGLSCAEAERLAADARRDANWKRWGPYLAERQWGTVREDYSPDGDCWGYFPHDHARSRAYRWGEDGLLGVCDRQCRLCFAVSLWNERDPILKERLFGLTGPEGNHGEDVKEHYFYLDSTPTHSHMRALYKYPQAAFPYERLVRENRERGRDAPEFELADAGVFDGGRYFDVEAEYAKASPDDLLIRLTVHNRGPDAAPLHLLPTLWFRNTWSWGCVDDGYESARPALRALGPGAVAADHPTLGRFVWRIDGAGPAGAPELLFTENETNAERLFGAPNPSPFVKDAFHARVIHGAVGAVSPAHAGTKAAAWWRLTIPAGGAARVRLRLRPAEEDAGEAFGPGFDAMFARRIEEGHEFYAGLGVGDLPAPERGVVRQAYAGLLWSKQFYHYAIEEWMSGDPAQPPPPPQRRGRRNADWPHLFNRDVISMPDKWEYPWYAAWDLAFQMIPFAKLDPQFAKEQLLLMLREWYMHPSGQIPAYEFAFSDVNPPVHAWACWRVYKMSAPRGQRDRAFLARAFQKLLINFTWWVNRKDPWGKHLFSGGFLGLDNIGVFDRSNLPGELRLAQADGTAWMAFYCGCMLSIALELAREDPTYEDVASKFFEHYVAIADAINHLGGSGLWDEQDGFYYDWLEAGRESVPLRLRSLVGVIPALAVEVIDEETIARLPGFRKRMEWFLQNRRDLARTIAYLLPDDEDAEHGARLLAIPSRERLERLLKATLDENELLSPFGIRSLSRRYADDPYVLHLDGQTHVVRYTPGESTSAMFGGNSNWRGPVWFPINFLLVEALERYARFYGQRLKVECPTGSGRFMDLFQVAHELRRRLSSLLLPGADGRRPALAGDRLLESCPHSRDLVLFHEHFHGDTGRGLGASHQTGWTALVAPMITDICRQCD